MCLTYMPKGSFEAIRDQAVIDVGAYRAYGPPIWTKCHECPVCQMLNNPAQTAKYLNDPNISFRRMAVSLVAEYWSSSKLFAHSCLRLGFGDPEAEIRGAAIVALVHKLHVYIDDPTHMLADLRQYLIRNGISTMAEAVDGRNRILASMDPDHSECIRNYEALAGNDLDSMLESPEAARTYLGHFSPIRRRAALCVLHTYWNAVPDSRDECIRLLLYDHDVDVRAEAQDVLSAAYARTDDREIGRLLARIVMQTKEPFALRKGACIALSLVRPMPMPRLLEIVSDDFSFPDDVDWQFVSSFVKSSE